MKDRRGFLLGEETLKIVIAVICIGVLVYFLVSLYSSHKTNQDLELAKASLQHLVDGINSELSETEVYNPEGWSILSWPHEYTHGLPLLKKTETGMPKFCLNLGWVSCLCICPYNNPNSCDDDGVCLNNVKGFMVEEEIAIKNPPIFLKIDKQNKKITLK